MEFIRYLPRKTLSRAAGWFAHLKLPAFLNQALILWFAQRYRINLAEAEKPIEAYACLGDFFVRKIKLEGRPLGDATVLHPADSVISQAGPIQRGELIQAKGLTYSLQTLVGDLRGWEHYLGGHFVTYYLCPTDYHRVHAPISGKIERALHIPGDLWPVNQWSASNVPRLFEVNERVVVEISQEGKRCLVIFVGATNVGSISIQGVEGFLSNQGQTAKRELSISGSGQIQKGDELGIFHMGSTVVMVLDAQWPVNSTSLEQLRGAAVQVRSNLPI